MDADPTALPVVWVVVLGDFGRSPRMQYHTLSLAKHGYSVHVLAQPGSDPLTAISEARNIHISHLPPPHPWVIRLPTLLSLAVKALLQLLLLLRFMLLALPRPTAILMQNPPAIPVMLVAWLAAARHRALLVIDWHNLAYSIMQLKYSHHAWLIALARGYEAAMGKRAGAAFCVTRAMQGYLQREFGVAALVLYDRPPAFFKPASAAERHELLQRLDPQLRALALGGSSMLAQRHAPVPGTGITSSIFTRQLGRGAPASTRPDRPALLVSSTSWTADEDFGLLLEACVRYDAVAGSDSDGGGAADARSDDGGGGVHPDLVVVITGRGPEREAYLERIRRLSLRKVVFVSLWLEAADYPRLLGAADLGVCLHTSSSGLDLPMKVVDMFGAGLPVCAAEFDCIGELVVPGRTGLLFRSGEELGDQLLQLLRGFPGGCAALAGMREAVAREQSGWRWDANWDEVAAPVFAMAAAARRQGRGKDSSDPASSS